LLLLLGGHRGQHSLNGPHSDRSELATTTTATTRISTRTAGAEADVTLAAGGVAAGGGARICACAAAAAAAARALHFRDFSQRTHPAAADLVAGRHESPFTVVEKRPQS
jgi:hypothetical protein